MLRLIINLDRCPERWIAMQSQLNSVGLDALRVSAVDSRVRGGGGKQEAAPLNSLKKYYFPRELSMGEICCYLSHKKCWQMLLASKEQWAVIFEDDAKFSPCIKDYVLSSDWIPPSLHIIQLHTYEKEWHGLTLPDPISLPNKNSALFHVIQPTYGTCAYVIDRQAAQKALSLSESLAAPVDEFLFNFKSPFTQEFPVWRLNPSCVLHDDGFQSDIGARRFSSKQQYSLINHLHPKRLFLSAWKSYLKKFRCKDIVFTWK